MKKLYSSYNLSLKNSFGVKAIADFFFEFESNEELIEFIQTEIKAYNPIYILGYGCNILMSKERINGIIIHSRDQTIEKIEEDESSVVIKVGAGYDWDNFVSYTLNNQWFGLENLSGIPGSTGASPVQNIGAYGIEVEDFIIKVETINLNDGTVKIFTHDDCHFSYRSSIFKMQKYKMFIITYVYYKLYKKPHINLSYTALYEEVKNINSPSPFDIRTSVLKIRDSKLPDHKKIGNAGSFFKNPVLDESTAKRLISLYSNIPYWQQADGNIKFSAAWFIDQCGFKGYTDSTGVGSYKLQPLILINQNNAQGSDILNFANLIIEKVKINFDITLEPEVNIW